MNRFVFKIMIRRIFKQLFFCSINSFTYYMYKQIAIIIPKYIEIS